MGRVSVYLTGAGSPLEGETAELLEERRALVVALPADVVDAVGVYRPTGEYVDGIAVWSWSIEPKPRCRCDDGCEACGWSGYVMPDGFAE